MNSAAINSATLLPANSRISSATGPLHHNHTRSLSSAPIAAQTIATGSSTQVVDVASTANTPVATTASSTVDISAEAAEISRQEQQQEKQQLRIEKQEIEQLASRDREVRNHERAHAAVGGQYAGAPRYQYERGPDGVNYAVSGEVSISTGPISGDPQATIEKAQVVRRSALAPAEPSGQDRKVAAQATQMEAQARVELLALEREERIQAQADNEQRNQDDQTPPTKVISDSSNSDHNSVSRDANHHHDLRRHADEPVENNSLASLNNVNQRLLSSTINAQVQPVSSGNIISLFA